MKTIYPICLRICLLAAVILFSERPVFAQQDRFHEIEQRLNDLSVTTPGLKEKAQFSVSGLSIQEFLRGLAEAHNLNINIDPALNVKVTNNFKNEKVANVLLFLARQYSLDFRFTGSIISISAFQAVQPVAPPPPLKVLNISYNEGQDVLSYDLSADTLGSVAKKISQLSGKNLVIGPGILNKAVTAFAQNTPFQAAIEKLAFSNNIKFNKAADGSFVLEPLADNEQLVPRRDFQSQSNYLIRRSIKSSEAGSPATIEVSPDPKGRRIVKVNALNSPIMDIIKTVAEEAQINYFIFSDIKGSVTATLNNVNFEDFLTMIFQGTNYTYKIDRGIYIIGERNLEGLRDHQVIQLQNRSIDSVQSFIPAEMKKGVEIKEFRELNSFLLTGSSPQINEIAAFIRNIDRPVPMITIEVIIVDVTKTRGISTGISAGTSDSVKTGGTLFPGLNYTFGSKSINNFLNWIGVNNIINIGKVTPSFYITLSALETNSNVDIRQTPKLSTLNGHVASLSIGNTRYYANSTQNVLGSLSTQTVVTQQYNPVDANMSIDVKPVVSGDEQVTLNIDVKISDFTGNPPVGPPPTSNSKFKSIIRVRNEEMVVLGGLERTEKDETGSGVPILSRIPILKWIFSSKTKTNSKTVSIIFIKPTIQY